MTTPIDPAATCPASGLRNSLCMATVCDCFPDETDRFGLYPEYYGITGTDPELAARAARAAEAESIWHAVAKNALNRGEIAAAAAAVAEYGADLERIHNTTHTPPHPGDNP